MKCQFPIINKNTCVNPVFLLYSDCSVKQRHWPGKTATIIAG